MAKSSGDGEANKWEMVKEAIAALGRRKAKPLAIQAYVKEKHGVELATTLISSYKSNMKNKGLLPGGRGKGRPAKAGAGASFKVEHFKQVKDLVTRIGSAQVKELIDLVG